MKLDTHIGEVPGVDAQRLPKALQMFDCRNNRLAELAVHQDGLFDAVQAAAARWGRRRVGVFIGTSTAGIMQTELAYRARDAASGALPPSFVYGTTHNSFSVADYLRQRCRLEGPAVAVSAACASSAKVFGSARRMIEAGLIDAALVGGTDSLCLTTLYGFHSLQLTSAAPCRPFDSARDGISIGEAAAFALLERVPETLDGNSVLLYGVGESSDAYHMSAPHPEGLGAKRAMQAALDAASMQPGDIDYINLHGTATPSNDRSESQASHQYFRPHHTLQLDEGRDRPYAGRGRCAGGGDQRPRHSESIDAGRHTHDPGRPDAHGPLHPRESACIRQSGAQQLIRFRRFELQFDFRPRRMKLSAYIGGIGILGPGLDNWPQTAAVLSGRQPYLAAPTALPTPAMLPPAERRRTGRVVKLALAVALEAVSQRQCRSR